MQLKKKIEIRDGAVTSRELKSILGDSSRYSK